MSYNNLPIGVYMNYKDKYLKYKTDYLKLKNINQLGGSESSNLIIHISGPSGSGKTTLGNKLKNKFGNKIVVKDIDDLRVDFIKKHYGDKKWNVIDKNAYQQYINDYIQKIHKKHNQHNQQNKQNKQKQKIKPIVFVGLNNHPWWHKDLYYDMHSNHNFYINLDDETIIKQKCIRFLTIQLKNIVNDDIAMNDLIISNEKFIKLVTNGINSECNASEIIKYNNKWKVDYKSQGYRFMSREKIYNSVEKLLYNKLNFNK